MFNKYCHLIKCIMNSVSNNQVNAIISRVIKRMQAWTPSSKNLQNAENVVTKNNVVKGQGALKQAKHGHECVTIYIIARIRWILHLT